MKNAHKLNELVCDVEELLVELKDEHGPEVQELRDRVEGTIASAKRAIGAQGQTTTARIGQYASSVDAYINDYPRLAFATSALVAGTLGYLAGLTAAARHG